MLEFSACTYQYEQWFMDFGWYKNEERNEDKFSDRNRRNSILSLFFTIVAISIIRCVWHLSFSSQFEQIIVLVLNAQQRHWHCSWIVEKFMWIFSNVNRAYDSRKLHSKLQSLNWNGNEKEKNAHK